MTALFAGSFDPFTIAHLDIARRAMPLFDNLIIAVGENYNKKSMLTVKQRVERIKALQLDNVTVTSYEGTTGDFAKQVGAQVLLRGARTTIDFEQEKTLADANRALFGLETVILLSKPELAYVSSTLVRDLISHDKDVSALLP